MRKYVLAILTAVALGAPALAQPAAGPNTWTIDPAHSGAGFSVKHLLVSTVRGTLGPVKGTIEYDGKSIEGLKVDATVDVTGINTGNTGRDKDLREAAGLFEVARYPTATFKSKLATPGAAGSFKLVGDLTIHGVTKEVALDVEGPSKPISMQGMSKTGATATTTINRKDFGLMWNRMIEGGGAVVGDDIKITLELELNKRTAPPTQ